MEGRDIGTQVFPQADLKIFLTARPEIRAERRLIEMEKRERFTPSEHEKMLEEIMRRDGLDSTRELAPLRQAKDAHLIDTSDLTIEGVINEILKLASRCEKK